MERERDEAMLLASLLAMSSLGVIHVGRKLDSFNLLVGGRILVLDFDVSHIVEGSDRSLLASLQVAVLALPHGCTGRSSFKKMSELSSGGTSGKVQQRSSVLWRSSMYKSWPPVFSRPRCS